ncbi:MAG: tetratricopeptide repeat protein [Candidatus Acidiferrum sp.]
MSGQSSRTWLVLILLPLGFAGVWRLQQGIDGQREALHQERDDLVLRSGKLVKAISLEYAPLVADLYWTRAVQYYGDKHARHDPNLELLWPLLDVTTTLDPKLLVAYRFGSTFLSEPSPRGAGEPERGIELLERGIKANPDYWRLYEDLGFIYYFEMKDYAKASEAFAEGSKNPKSLIWMKVMAAKIATEGESLSTSIFLWNEVYNSAKDPEVKKNALTHLRLLKVQEDCKQLDALADEFQKQTKRRPERMGELVQAGLLPRVPVDPMGYSYVFGPDGKAALNLDSPLLEQQLMHEKPK